LVRKIGACRVKRLDLDDQVVDADAGTASRCAGSWTSSMVTKGSPGSCSMVRLPNGVPSTVPVTV